MNENFSEGGNDNATDVTGAVQSKRCGGSNVGVVGCTDFEAAFVVTKLPGELEQPFVRFDPAVAKKNLPRGDQSYERLRKASPTIERLRLLGFDRLFQVVELLGEKL